MSEGLRLCGFVQEAEKIELLWNQLLGITKEKPSDEFDLCFPPTVLRWLADVALAAYQKMGCKTASPKTPGRVAGVLNEAWAQFWRDQAGYPTWENSSAHRLFVRQ